MTAAVNPLKSLRDEATCSICLSFFKDPVSLDCRHNFCRACISQCWEESDADISCPQCRETFPQRTLRPNRLLANVVEIAKQLSFQAAAGEDLCKVHQEPFKLFCSQDQILLCVICRESQGHRAHNVIPIEEAAQSYKGQIQTRLNTLKKEREELLKWRQDEEKQSQEYLGKIEVERQKIMSEFEQLRLFLEAQERLLLAWLEELDKETVKMQDENVTKLSEEISRLSDLISEIEKKCQQPTSEFLQDIKSTWSRCEKRFQKPVAVPKDLAKRLSVSSQRNVCLQETLKKFKESLPYHLSFLISKAEKEVQATLDPDLANPCSVVSTDESVIHEYQHTEFLEKQNRFYPAPCVLGLKGFTSGRCYWEVEVGNKNQWVLGIAKQSVIDQGVISRTPGEGIWALEHTTNKYWALTSPKSSLNLLSGPSKIGVYLDYEGEKVTFYEVTFSGREPIFTFTASFTGKIIPFFGSRHIEFQSRNRLDPWYVYH
ncbi:zinc finger protein RFP-like isoform X1 [Gopherus evgoodei]|uniref:zinc finger protein RFP-like isoform X1 n=1 Tax=Gopherus evgoodei TaxID=1825980 RepID=UPI0011CF0650|nr:zinc finger protein RFP-like isoform X1 [Gopherus evgoodei]